MFSKGTSTLTPGTNNNAAWRLLSLPLHETHPPVIHLVVHLANGKQNDTNCIFFSFSFSIMIPSLKHLYIPKFLTTIRGTCPGRNGSAVFKGLLSKTGRCEGRRCTRPHIHCTIAAFRAIAYVCMLSTCGDRRVSRNSKQ
ncbi:hypothetical protein PR048_020350 [Dryococelus australis]|uniref:Uncharacterized protein n=1 Tax=Dryococelus australis TaxID=614101 RepID=A0ABQ9H644_9NEOP|nr:hypothetical protein PR048_020350 [Dryococelus australis]